MRPYSVVLLPLALLATDVYAQNTESESIQRDVDVVNIYQPTLRRARKLSVAPVLDDTAAFKPSFSYETLNRISVVSTTPDSLTAADMVFSAYDSPYRALAQGAVGSSPILFGQIFYNISNSKKYHLSLRAGHRAMLGKVKMYDDSKVKAPQNDSWASVDFNFFKKKIRFGANVDFSNSAYRFYGLNSIVDSLNYVTEEGLDVSGADLLDVLKQRNTICDVDLSWSNKLVNPRDGFTFDAHAGAGIFGNRYGVHETDMHFSGLLRFPIKDNSAILANVGVNHFKLHEGDETVGQAYRARHNTDIDIFPHFLLDYDIFNLNLGLRILAIIGDNTTKDDFIVQPDIRVDFFAGDGSVLVYAGVTGDYKSNSYRQLVSENRYLSPDSRMYVWRAKDNSYETSRVIRCSQSPIVFQFGVRAKFAPAFQMHVGIDYHSLGDENFFVNRMVSLNDSVCAHTSQFAILQDDGKLFRAHAELNVNPTKNSNVALSASYNSYKMNYLQEAWYKPKYELQLSGNFKPMERLRVNASFALKGDRFAYNPSSKSKEKLDAFLDLNVGAHYYISNRWTAFLNLNNLTAADQMEWLGYSTYRINCMAGVTYKF